MKKLLLLLCLALPSFGQIALVAHVSTTLLVSPTTSGINTTGATLLVANITAWDAAPLSYITDSNNNTWVPFPTYLGNFTAQTQQMFYAINPVVGSGHTFTIGAGTQGSLEVGAFSGVTGVLPFDKSAPSSTTGTTSASSIQPGSLTPTNANSLIVSAVSFQNNGTQVSSINSGFTITDTNASASGLIGGSMAYLIQTTATAVNPTWSFSGGGNLTAEQMVFIAGTAKPPTTPSLISHTLVSGNATTPAINTTGATFLGACVSGFAGIGTVSDSKSNTWTALTVRSNGSYEEILYYVANPIVGTGHTFTLNGNSGNGALEVAAFSGVKTTSPFDVENGSTPTGFGGNPGSITPTASTASLLLTCIGIKNTGSPVASGIDLGYRITDFSPTGGGTVGSALAWLPLSAKTATNPTWTLTNNIQNAIESAVFAAIPVSSAIHHSVSSQ